MLSHMTGLWFAWGSFMQDLKRRLAQVVGHFLTRIAILMLIVTWLRFGFVYLTQIRAI